MEKWYLRQLEDREPPNNSEFILDGAVGGPNLSNDAAVNPNFDIVLYVNLEVEQLKKSAATLGPKYGVPIRNCFSSERR